MMQIIRWSDVTRPRAYLKQYEAFCEKIWPSYLTTDTFLNAYDRLVDIYPENQLIMIDPNEDRLVAGLMAIPIEWHESYDLLPEEGWDWAIKKGFQEHNNGRTKNTLCVLELSIDPDYQGLLLSKKMLKFALKKAKADGFQQAFGPARPNDKVKYPEVPINEYINWKDDKGRPFDSWLRFHTLIGGKIHKSCNKSMVVKSSVRNWEKWTDCQFSATGEYRIPGGLSTLTVDLANQTGIYSEPNVWMIYDVEDFS